MQHRFTWQYSQHEKNQFECYECLINIMISLNKYSQNLYVVLPELYNLKKGYKK